MIWSKIKMNFEKTFLLELLNIQEVHDENFVPDFDCDEGWSHKRIFDAVVFFFPQVESFGLDAFTLRTDGKEVDEGSPTIDRRQFDVREEVENQRISWKFWRTLKTFLRKYLNLVVSVHFHGSNNFFPPNIVFERQNHF